MTENKECKLIMSADELESIKDAEAVLLVEFETSSRDRVAELIGWGDFEAMDELSKIRSTVVMPVGLKIIAQKAVLVDELLAPKYEDGSLV